MKRVRLVSLLTAILVLVSGCGLAKETVGDPVDAYMAVIMALEDPELFGQETELQYIAVDTRKMSGFMSGDNKERFLDKMAETYKTVEILDKNEVQLARGGYLTENRFDDGVLFKLKESDYSTYEENPVEIEVQEWGRGAETKLDRKFVLEAGEDGWTIIEVTELEQIKIIS